MPGKTTIEWATDSWNPTVGCYQVSPGCENCYAEALATRFGWTKHKWSKPNARMNVKVYEDRLGIPLRWWKHRRVFVNSMSDLFLDEITETFLDKVFAVMAATPRHTYLILTKRPERMRAYLKGRQEIGYPVLPNVKVGVSVEDQRRLDERIELLIDTPASGRFLSAEPLLEAVDLRPYLRGGAVNWVIVGGESGGPADRRLVEQQKGRWVPIFGIIPMVRDIRNDCVEAGVPFFFKQWGGPTHKSGGRILDGREWNEVPDGW